MKLHIGDVELFDHVECSKAQCVKVLEEAAEVFGAYQKAESFGDGELDRTALLCMLDECADVIQATSNLIGATFNMLWPKMSLDFTEAMTTCRVRNVIRGRITDGAVKGVGR